MHFVYLLVSEKDEGFYIGYTADIDIRVREHKNGLVMSTRNRRPLQLAYFEAYNNEKLAREREMKLKEFGSAYSGLLKRLGYK